MRAYSSPWMGNRHFFRWFFHFFRLVYFYFACEREKFAWRRWTQYHATSNKSNWEKWIESIVWYLFISRQFRIIFDDRTNICFQIDVMVRVQCPHRTWACITSTSECRWLCPNIVRLNHVPGAKREAKHSVTFILLTFAHIFTQQ